MGGVDSWFVNEEKSGPPSLGWSTELDRIDGANRISAMHFKDLDRFSSSLPSLFRQTLNISSNGDRPVNGHLTVEDGLERALTSQAIGDLLPDDEEELLAGIVTGFNSTHITNRAAEENEDFDLFSNLGGLEMDGELQEGFGIHVANRPKLATDGYGPNSTMDGLYGVAVGFQGSANGPGSVVGEHPYGEHPSRTLFVRNINSNVEDSELRALFEHYGDIRTLYTACKHRGFVMISYYDIRAAKSAMRALQNKPLRRRKLDIHFSIPKDNPSDKDLNQGTLVVFNLDSSVSNDDLRHIFGQYGEVKEIRETPHKCHHKFIEFYDVRAAEAALRALNRSDIAGKRIKLEPSRPGGARRSWMQNLSQDPDQDDARIVWPQSSPPVSNSPLGHLPSWGHFGSPLESGASWSTRHSYGTPVSSISKTSSGPSNSLHSNPMHLRAIGNHFGWNNQNDAGLSHHQTSLSGKGIYSHHAHSLPEHRNGLSSYNPSSLIPTPMRTMESQLQRLLPEDGLRIPRGGTGISKTGASQQLNLSSGRNVHLSDSQFPWDSSNMYDQNVSPMTWNSPSMTQASNSAQFTDSFNGFAGNHYRLTSASHRHQVGSAPSGDSSFMERQFVCLQPPVDASVFTASQAESFNNALVRSGNDVVNRSNSHRVSSASLGSDVSFRSGSLGLMSPHRNLVLPNNGLPIGSPFDMLSFDRWRLQQTEISSGQMIENKSQYQLDIDRIMRGEDNRTTLMIKNIPNKYTSKMLLAAIDENHRGMYDFLYLPIDFKNKCNVGYAFINMTSPNHIVSLYQAFNGKKWEKFNSEKVASLAYARIQGKAALVAHFQNSSLMNEDKRCRPILFHSSGSETGEQEPSFFELGMQGGIRDLVGISSYEFVGDRDSLTSGNPVACSSAIVDPNSE